MFAGVSHSALRFFWELLLFSVSSWWCKGGSKSSESDNCHSSRGLKLEMLLGSGFIVFRVRVRILGLGLRVVD